MEGWGDGGLGISWASARASAYAVSSASSSGVGAAFFAGFAWFAGVDAFAGFEDFEDFEDFGLSFGFGFGLGFDEGGGFAGFGWRLGLLPFLLTLFLWLFSHFPTKKEQNCSLKTHDVMYSKSLKIFRVHSSKHLNSLNVGWCT